MNLDEATKPSLGLLVKLGSIVVHAEEFLETGNSMDAWSIKSLLEDPEVREWRMALAKAALLPVKR